MTDRLENNGVTVYIEKQGFVTTLHFKKDGKKICKYSRTELLKVFTATKTSELPTGMRYDKEDPNVIYIKDSITLFKDYLKYITEYMKHIGE